MADLSYSAQQAVCALTQPENCIGQVVELVLVDGAQVTGMVTQVRVGPVDRALELNPTAGGVTLVNLDMVRELRLAGAAVELAAPDLLLLALIGLLLIALVALLFNRRRTPTMAQPARDAIPVSGVPIDEPYITNQSAAYQALAALPLPDGLQARRVDPMAVDVPLTEKTYATIGGGLGSLAWVQALRIAGCPAHDIAVVGLSAQPYAGYRLRCHRSQLFDDDRIRSDSGSTPDNLWGWPGYAVREAGRELRRGRVGRALGIMWQIMAEPALAEIYSPRAGDVYYAIDRECARLDWEQMRVPGRVRCLRQTTDGRYLLLYALLRQDGQWEQRGLLVRYLHLASGCTQPRILPEMERYRQHYPDDARVTHVYEAHDGIYARLAEMGGTVLLRGRGIAAAQILKRLAELREVNGRIRILHVIREPNPRGQRQGWVARRAHAHWELQIYNWPKSAFGGGWRDRLARADADHQQYLLATLGEPTVPPRRDWLRLVEAGRREGWYQQYIGTVQAIENDAERLHVTLDNAAFDVHYVIDATGLVVDFDADTLLRDLCATYGLPLNRQGRLAVTEAFEVTALRQAQGRVYASGIITAGNHYAPVDSFIGLQYAGLSAVDDLAQLNAPGVRRISGLYSARQWWRWARGVTP